MAKCNKKILIILPKSIGGRLTTSSIIDGFKALDFETCIFDRLKDPRMPQNIFDYDFVVGYDFDAVEFCQTHNFDAKTVNYFSDVIEDAHSGKDWEKYYPLLLKNNSVTFYWDRELFKKTKNKIKNLFYLPHFVNTDIYKNTKTEKFFDIIFTGRLDTQYRLSSFLKLMKSLPDLKFGWFAIEKHYLDAIKRSSQEDRKLLSKAYQYFIDNEAEMAGVLNQAKVVVNFNEQGISSLNYRTIQSMACETFLLSDFRQEGIDYFKDNFVFYRNFDELVEKAEYYVSNNEERNKINRQIRKIIEKSFSHTVGAQKMIEKIEEVFYA